MLVWLRHPLHISLLGCIICCASICYRCTHKTQEFRIKDFFVRRAHSIEHQKCKYCLWRNRRRIRKAPTCVYISVICGRLLLTQLLSTTGCTLSCLISFSHRCHGLSQIFFFWITDFSDFTEAAPLIYSNIRIIR